MDSGLHRTEYSNSPLPQHPLFTSLNPAYINQRNKNIINDSARKRMHICIERKICTRSFTKFYGILYHVLNRFEDVDVDQFLALGTILHGFQFVLEQLVVLACGGGVCRETLAVEQWAAGIPSDHCRQTPDWRQPNHSDSLCSLFH